MLASWVLDVKHGYFESQIFKKFEGDSDPFWFYQENQKDKKSYLCKWCRFVVARMVDFGWREGKGRTRRRSARCSISVDKCVCTVCWVSLRHSDRKVIKHLQTGRNTHGS
jgi:hypothetical protein